MTITNVQFLPIVKEYARRINLAGTQMTLQPGVAIPGMVLDTLSGRSPLYRLKHYFEGKDIELLLGEAVHVSQFTDYNVGRALDKIFNAGTQKIFSQLSQNAIGGFHIEVTAAHYDTTSVTVHGDYAMQDEPFKITHGYSKDKRPDLKQFLVEMLCVDKNIPVLGATRDGNASDKTLNNELLSTISKHMAHHGLSKSAFVYVADSAFVTKENLKKAGNQTKFVSRLPATYKECRRVIREAVQQNAWIDIGQLAETQGSKKRPAAHYKVYDSTVTFLGRPYRAIVVHSSAHDKRRHKRIDRQILKSKERLENKVKKINIPTCYCEADARSVVEKLLRLPVKSDCYLISATIKKIAKYGRGRPRKGEERIPQGYEYQIEVTLEADEEKIKTLRQEAGCFVLLSNLISESEQEQWDGKALLKLYKTQIGIEQNFGFLKNPVIINSVFLKKVSRIEVLGMILLISLLIWRLIERSMRNYVEENDTTITGWVNRRTKKPTSFMMTTKFISVMVVKYGGTRHLSPPLNSVRLEYLKALDVDPEVFIRP
jgi:transposase